MKPVVTYFFSKMPPRPTKKQKTKSVSSVLPVVTFSSFDVERPVDLSFIHLDWASFCQPLIQYRKEKEDKATIAEAPCLCEQLTTLCEKKLESKHQSPAIIQKARDILAVGSTSSTGVTLKYFSQYLNYIFESVDSKHSLQVLLVLLTLLTKNPNQKKRQRQER